MSGQYKLRPRLSLYGEGFSLSVVLVPHNLQCYSKLCTKFCMFALNTNAQESIPVPVGCRLPACLLYVLQDEHV